MQHVEPFGRRAVQRSGLEAERRLGFGAGEDLVGGNVPVPDHVAGAGQRQRAALDVGDDAVRHAAGEGVLHDRKADQHDDQHQAAEQRRADDVVGDEAEHGRARRRSPRPPAEARSGSASPRGRSRGSRDRPPAPKPSTATKNSDMRAMPEATAGENSATATSAARNSQPAERDVRVAHVPAIEVEIGEQKHQQRRREDRFAGGAPDALGARPTCRTPCPRSRSRCRYRPAPPSRARRRPGTSRCP